MLCLIRVSHQFFIPTTLPIHKTNVEGLTLSRLFGFGWWFIYFFAASDIAFRMISTEKGPPWDGYMVLTPSSKSVCQLSSSNGQFSA
jgi:hypothetical protein